MRPRLREQPEPLHQQKGRFLQVNTHPIAGTPTVFLRAKADHSKVRVNGIPGHPGHYVVHLAGHNDVDLHVTAAQWDVIDSKVRAGIIAAQTRAVAL